MDKFIISVAAPPQNDRGIVIRIDSDSANLLHDIQSKTGASNRFLVSEMIKFCYDRTVINRVTVDFKDKIEREEK